MMDMVVYMVMDMVGDMMVDMIGDMIEDMMGDINGGIIFYDIIIFQMHFIFLYAVNMPSICQDAVNLSICRQSFNMPSICQYAVNLSICYHLLIR